MLILLAAIAAAVPRSPCESHEAPTVDMTGDVRGEDLTCADLRLLDLRGIDLTGADLTGAWLHGSDLRGATLVDAQMYFSHLEGADLRDADLTDAYLRRSVLRDANLYGATLTGTDLCWVDLTTVEYITAAETVGTRYCRSTLRPDELFRPDDEFDWHFMPFFREPRQNLVTLNALDGLSLIEYPDRRLSDAPDDVRLFDAVGTTVGLNVIGAELVPRFLDASHRHTLSSAGLLVGIGFGSGQLDGQNFSFATMSGGVFIRPLSFIQLETGVTGGAAFDDTFAEKADATVYYGVRVNIRPLVDLLDDVAEVLF
jgi:hypothetical protein